MRLFSIGKIEVGTKNAAALELVNLITLRMMVLFSFCKDDFKILVIFCSVLNS